MVDFLCPPNIPSRYSIKRKKIVILGAGLSGLSTSFFLKKIKIEAPIFEKEKECGGLCRSIKKDGFIFDFSGHLLHFRNRKILSLVRSLLGSNLIRHRRNSWIYTFNKFIPYPFQTNLHYLPKKIAKECLLRFTEFRNNGLASFNGASFSEWINRQFGSGIARHFMIPYNEKFWKTPLKKLTYDWAERFILMPSSEDIIKDSCGRSRQDLGYNASFWYPKTGGIEELIKVFTPGVKDVFLNREAKEIDLKKKIITFKNGPKEKYDILISTVPLPELAKIVKGLPKSMLSNFKKLKWLSIYNINFGIEKIIQPNRHWIYFPQKNIPFFRTGFFHNFSSSLTPVDKGSIYIEISYTKDKPIAKKNITLDIRKDLEKIGIVKKGVRVCCEDAKDIKYGYPIYDSNYSAAKDAILKFLSQNNIISCGRFGGWQYFSMEDVILEAQEIANLFLKNV